MTFPDGPADWLELDGVLREHCERVGRDQSEIATVGAPQLRRGRDVGELADRAAGFFDAGVDIVVWSMRGPVEASRLEPLAHALA